MSQAELGLCSQFTASQFEKNRDDVPLRAVVWGMWDEPTANADDTGDGRRPGRAMARRLWARALAGTLQVRAASGDFEVGLETSEDTPGASTLDGACLEQVVFGRSQKVLAIDSERSPASISGNLRRHLGALGLRTSSRRLPLPLALLAHAANSESVDVVVRAAGSDAHSWVLVAQISEGALGRLTSAERDVTLRYLRGQSHLEIAKARGSRPRTVANQLGTVFHRFSATGRFDLLRALIDEGPRAGQRSSLCIYRPAAESAPALAHAG